MTDLFALPSLPTIDLKLRPYQTEAVRQAREYDKRGGRHLLIQMLTGSGKTATFTYIITETVRNGGTALVLAHRQELVTQPYDKLTKPRADGGLGVPAALVGVIMAKDRRTRPSAPIQIGSVQTFVSRMARRGAKPDGTAWTAAELGFPPADVVVIDEAHRGISASHQQVVGLYPNALHIGVTATPYRLDGRGLNEFYDYLIVGPSAEQLIAGGWLVRTRVYSHPVKADLSGVRTNRGGDYDEQALAEAVDQDVLVGNIVDHWLTHAGGARTFAFGAGVPHAKHIRDMFLRRGVPSAFVGADTPRVERERILNDLRAGRVLVVSSYDVLSEGIDIPEVKCVALARPTKSENIYRQQIGRGMRVVEAWPTVTTCVVLDHAGLSLRYGLPEDAQKFALNGRERRGTGEAPVKECPGCWRVIPANVRECPECGYLFGEDSDGPGSRLKEKNGELVEVKAKLKAKLDELRRTINDICLGSDEARGWKYGETNRAVLDAFGKSRKDMGIEELQSVMRWLMSPDFAREFPVP